MLAEGTEAPSFALNDQDGNVVRLADLSGKWVAMWWYPKASTPG
jgi:thioredoxin-dependent peroxiredoxin